jgi:hypothetical protein
MSIEALGEETALSYITDAKEILDHRSGSRLERIISNKY